MNGEKLHIKQINKVTGYSDELLTIMAHSKGICKYFVKN
jgi:hypothetical protein